MERVKFLTSDQIFISPFEQADLLTYHIGKNSEIVRETLFSFRPCSTKELEEEINSWIVSKEIEFFTICENSGNPIGQTAFVRIDYVSRAAIFFIAIYDENCWSKGYGTEATSLMIKYAFDILNLNRIQLHVSSENIKGIKAYQKVGFEIEGTLREAMYHNNRYVDFIVMGILRKDYYNKSRAK